MDSGPYVNDFDDNRFAADLVGHHFDVQGLLPCSAIPSHRLVAFKAAFHGGTATLDSGLQYVNNTTECFDGVMVQIREFLIVATQ